MIEGACLCGGVRYRAEEPLIAMVRCHCVQCRKASGAEFATNASVNASGFRLLAGEELLKEWESSPGQLRAFCGRCGSPLFKRKSNQPDLLRLRLGCVETKLGERPVCHVFVAEKPAWSDITDGLPQFDTLPPPTTKP